MHSAKHCADAGALFHKINASLQLGGAEKNVVEQAGHLDCRKKLTRCDEYSCGESQKAAAREYWKRNHNKPVEKAPASEGGHYILCASGCV